MNDSLKEWFTRLYQGIREPIGRAAASVRQFVRQKILKQSVVSRADQADHNELSAADAQTGGQVRVAPARRPRAPIRRRGRQRVYRLKGYTTVAKINHKRQSERQQRFLRRLLIFLVSILIIFLLFHLYNPIKDLTEWYRIIGIKDISDLAPGNTTETGATAGSGTSAGTGTTAGTGATIS